jgi:hypothetical protein
MALAGAVAMRLWPQLSAVRVTACIVLLISLLVLCSAALLNAGVRGSDAKVGPGDPGTPAERARFATDVLVGSLALVCVGLVYEIVARLPLGAGGMREKCVQIEVSTAGMPLRARQELVGRLAEEYPSPGTEMTLPARILRKDSTEAFLWMSTRKGVTVPLSKVGVIVDLDDAACSANPT